MGATNHDKQAQHRAYEQRYALDNADGVRLLLSDYHALVSRQYRGDYAATDVLIDLATAIDRAGLTDRQRQAIALVFFEDLTQADAGDRMGVRQDTVSKLVKSALVKIAAVYEKWAWRGEGYALTKRHEIVNEWSETTVWASVIVPITIKHGKWRTVR
jgi:DNA-directed RNA polymerase specialized sigma24 family protein